MDMLLKNLIVSEITNTGPITISRFMEHCLYHKQFGYYSRKNTIGRQGDFITSPEISQVFGELIGAWLAQTWVDRGMPTPFSLVELGPGNGTMMRDILNAMRTLPEFTGSASIILVEKSPTLKDFQKAKLANHNPTWIENVLDIPEEPLFLIANEFLDALPIRQFKKNNNNWFERSIGLTSNGELHFVYIPSNFNNELNLLYRDIPNDVIIEISDIAKNILSILSEKLLRHGGVALFIDYGYFEGTGETLQAVSRHAFSNPLENLGESDLTSQVNFKNIYNLVNNKGLRATNMLSQGKFLMGLGIKSRSELLKEQMSGMQRNLHISAVNRLTDEDKMGSIFQVMGVTNVGSPALPILESS